jgi:hypothetical protein
MSLAEAEATAASVPRSQLKGRAPVLKRTTSLDLCTGEGGGGVGGGVCVCMKRAELVCGMELYV